MSYRQGGKYPDRDRGYDRGGPSRDYRAPPARGRQQLNYDDLDGDSTGLPPPRYPRGAFEDDRNSYRASGYDRRGGGGPYDRRRSRSPPPPPRRDDYRDRGASFLSSRPEMNFRLITRGGADENRFAAFETFSFAPASHSFAVALALSPLDVSEKARFSLAAADITTRTQRRA